MHVLQRSCIFFATVLSVHVLLLGVFLLPYTKLLIDIHFATKQFELCMLCSVIKYDAQLARADAHLDRTQPKIQLWMHIFSSVVLPEM